MQTAVRVTHQTSDVLTPTAGPGDQELAFLSDRGGHANLWVINFGNGTLRQITNERDPKVTIGVPVWSPVGDSIAYVSSRRISDAPGDKPLEPSKGWGIWLVNPTAATCGTLSRWVSRHPGRRMAAGSTTPRWLPGGLFKIGAEGGTPETVRTDKLRNLIGADGTTAYMVFERTLVDGMPVLEIHAASPENGPTRRIADVSLSRVPTWQILNPSLSPGGKWIAMALADGFSTNIWTLSTSTGEWRQITDFGGRPTFIARRVSWSSDGRSVVAAVADGDADIFLLDGLLNEGRD